MADEDNDFFKLSDFLFSFLPDDKELISNAKRIFDEKRDKYLAEKKCFLCGREFRRIKSHHIPYSILRNIQQEEIGKYNFFLNLPFISEKVDGAKKAGTFRLICSDCDRKYFQNYEKKELYFDEKEGNSSYSLNGLDFITDKFVTEIALKNYLKSFYERDYEKLAYDALLLAFQNKFGSCLLERYIKNDMSAEEMQTYFCNMMGYYCPRYANLKRQYEIYLTDLNDYNRIIHELQQTYNNNEFIYKPFFVIRLNYVVPYAAQSDITLYTDFKGTLINDCYDLKKSASNEEIHVAVFPLKNTSYVIAGFYYYTKKYNNFILDFEELSIQDKLRAINYIIFKYCDDYYFSKKISLSWHERKSIAKVIDSTQFIRKEINYEKIIKFHSLNNRYDIPNLLDKKYAIG